MDKKLSDKISTAIISLDTMTKTVYDKFSKMAHLQNKNYLEVWSHYPMCGKGNFNPQTMVKESSIIESYLLLNYLRKENVNCRFWYNNALFIYNEKLFRIVGQDIVEVDLEGLYYFSLRESFSHPFFSILEILLEQNNGKLAKPNKATMLNVGCMNKMHALKQLYKNREKYVQDVIIPYNLQASDYPVFMNFIKSNLGNKIVFKNDGIQEGKGVIFKNIENNIDYPELKKSLSIHKQRQRELLITPAFEIKDEYRCYFTNYENNAKVFSIKQRQNMTEEEDYYNKEHIHINVNMKVKWHEVKKKSEKFKFASTIAKEMISLMDYDTGCIEFAITNDDKIVFFEVNQMAGPLPFEGEDTTNINDFYLSIFDEMVR
ncbi:hypothetical protein ACH5BF_05220 [Arcobacter sp. YIC-464]|uniref:hypothetical protein n=1 Tax=Arcobacter sp. YIC-464 TaxID=3376631 RepID=UPI003C1BFBE6